MKANHGSAQSPLCDRPFVASLVMVVALSTTAAGCGRIGFGLLPDPDASSTDDARIGSPIDASSDASIVVAIDAGVDAGVVVIDANSDAGAALACGGLQGLHISNDLTLTGIGNLVSLANGNPNDPNAAVAAQTITNTVPAGVTVIDVVNSSHAEPIFGLAASCYATTGGTVFCLGDNTEGQLGNGTTVNSATPVQVLMSGGSPLTNVVQLTGANAAFYALRSDGTAWAWGHNGHGELGVGDLNFRSTAQLVTSNVNKIITGPDPIGNGSVQAKACVLKTTGTIECWGSVGNGAAFAGAGASDPQLTPIAVQLGDGSGPLTGIVNVGGTTPAGQAGGSDFHVCGLKADKSLWCFGTFGPGFSTAGIANFGPDAWLAASNVTSFFNHPWGTCWTATDTTVWCTGANQNGENGGTPGNQQSTPIQIKDNTGAVLTGAVEVVGGIFQSSCARKSDGSVWCWGARYADHQGTSTAGNTALEINYLGTPLTGVTQLTSPTNSNAELFIAITAAASYVGTDDFNYAAHQIVCGP